MEKRFMQTYRSSSSNLWRVAFAVLVGIAGFASNTHAQTSYQTVDSFGRYDANGANPVGDGLVQGSDGSFYGTTSNGGTAGYGTIFKIGASWGNTVKTVYSFHFSDGADPRARLIQGSDGSLYGTTYQGGGFGFGTVFKMDAAGTLTTLHSFNDSDGAYPEAGLVQGRDGSFYGATADGGAAAYGTVFKIDAAGALTTLHSFNYGDGMSPIGAPVQGRDGNFYGT